MRTKESLTEFIKRFDTDDKCKQHLFDLKWSCGFECRKCGHDASKKGQTWSFKRCKKCGYDESSTAHTLFHKVKFPLSTAFAIIYQLTTMKKGMSTLEIARQHCIHQETAWYFKRKVQQAMSLSSKGLLTRSVEVDELVIGGPEKGKQGRSHGKKKKVQIAVEIDYPEGDGSPKIRGADARLIENYSTKELSQGIENMVNEDALVTTDAWRPYIKAVGERTHLMLESKKGTNFEKLHWHIFNLKNWLRGTHHRVSKEHLQLYLDEFHFRFRNRNKKKTTTEMVIKLMVNLPWLPYSMAKAS